MRWILRSIQSGMLSRVLLAGLALSGCQGAAAMKAAPVQTLTDVRVLDLDGSTQVVLEGERTITYTMFSLDSPPRLILNLPAASRGRLGEKIQVRKGDLVAIALADRANPNPTLQVEIQLARMLTPQVRVERNRLLVDIPKSKSGRINGAVEDYRIGPEDQLEILVWKNQDISRQITVRPDGKISLPLIGDLQASGMTTQQLEGQISDRLKTYIETPQVSVLVSAVNSYFFYITGEISRPGKYPMRGRTTLLQAVSMAGGFTPFASRNNISVFRKDPTGAQESRIRVRYDEILSGGDANANVLLETGDTIVVP